MPAVPAAVPDRQAAAREELHTVGGCRQVDALRPGEDDEQRQSGSEQRRNQPRAGRRDHATILVPRRAAARSQRFKPSPRAVDERSTRTRTRDGTRAESQIAPRSVTLRLITDTTGVPGAAPGAARPKLGPEVFEELFENAGSLLAILDDEARFVAVNPACRRVLGYPPENLVGRSLMDFLHPHDPTAELRRSSGPQGWQEGFVELLARHRHADGSWRSLLWSGQAHGQFWYASAKDVTEWLRLENRVGRDPLTGLHNREVFTDELTRALARHGRSNLHLGVLFIDIDSLQADQRQQWPRCRRRAPGRGRAAPARGGARRRRRRSHRRRRVRDPARAARERLRGGGRGAARAAGLREALRARRRDARGLGERRSRDGARCPEARRPPGPGGRHRDVPREGDRPQPLRRLRHAPARRRPPPPDRRARPAQRAAAQRVRRPLPAGRVADRRDRRLVRGAAALDPPRLRA